MKKPASKGATLVKKVIGSREFSLLIVLAVLCVVAQIFNHEFLTMKNINNLLKNYSYTMILSVGMLLVLLIGGIDLSIGATLTVSSMAASLMARSGLITNVPVMYVVSIIVGAVCGALIGLVISKGKVIPIIATLGFQYIYRGLSYLISGFKSVNGSQLPEGIKAFSTSKTLGFSNLIYITLAVYIIFFFVLRWTKFGRRIYSVGSNPEAAKVSGIRVDMIKTFVYSIMGALCGLCGMMMVTIYTSGRNNYGIGIEMDVIASCVVGGASLSGGQGNVIGVLLGSLTIAVINRLLPLVGINPFWQQALKGVVILFAVLMNVMLQRSARRRVLKEREV